MGKAINGGIKVTGIFQSIRKSEGLTQTQVAKIMGYASQSNVARKVMTGVTLSDLYLFTQKLGGYRMVVEKVSPKGKVTERYVIGEESGDN